MSSNELFDHTDQLSDLNKPSSLNRKLALLHQQIQAEFPFIQRVAVALYDPKSNLLKTFLASMDDHNPLVHYQASLEDAPGLKQVLEIGQPRVVNDLHLFDDGIHEHTRLIRQKGYAASYTFPIFTQGSFMGFIFFNSYQENCFHEDVLRRLDLYAHLISRIVISQMSLELTLVAALKTAQKMVHYRDPETGNHLERMSRFARLIAIQLADLGISPLDDETIERIFMFAPMHDVGKIAIPDQVLIKPARLSESEFNLMKTHTVLGRQMIDELIDNFGLHALEQMDLLRHIAEFHHETLDGEGYPQGLRGKEIPLEARITAVADVFDALTSARPYKPAWTNQQAFDTLTRMAHTKLDEDCIRVLIEHSKEVEEIQQTFRDE
jgi:HD-GYP domain-containing protein (c-di-GMP phosphodiesterase class II)